MPVDVSSTLQNEIRFAKQAACAPHYQSKRFRPPKEYSIISYLFIKMLSFFFVMMKLYANWVKQNEQRLNEDFDQFTRIIPRWSKVYFFVK